MTEIELKLFIAENEPEIRYDNHDCFIWVHGSDLIEWAELIQDMLEEGGHDCSLLSDGSVWFDLGHICKYQGIDVSKVLTKD